jgi:hypothetical protein
MSKTRDAQIRIDEVKKQMENAISTAQKKYPKLTMEEVTNAALQIALLINQVEIETYCEK